MDEAGAAAVNGAGEEGHAEGFLAGDALEGADEVGAFEVLGMCVSRCVLGGNEVEWDRRGWGNEDVPLIHASTDRGARRACQCRQRG